MPEPAELPDGQPRALEQRPRLARQHPHGPPVGERGDHAESRAAPRRREAARVAVGEDREGTRLGAPRRVEPGPRRLRRQPAAAPRRAARRRARPARRSRPRPRAGSPRPPRARPPRADGPGGQRGRAHALDRPGEVARRRPAGRQPLGAALQRAERRLARDLHREPERGRDADQRRAAHRRAARSRAPCPPRPRARAPPRSPGSRVWSSTCSRAPSQRSGGGARVELIAAILRTDACCPVGHGPAQGLRLGAGAARSRPRARSRASCSACSARTAPASRRSSRSPAGSSGPTLGHGAASAAAPPARPPRTRSSATSPSCSASPTGAPRTSCSALHQELRRLAGRRGRAARAARARRARPRPRPPRRRDVEGDAAAARARAGADRRAAAAAARRADERARPRRPPHRPRAARAAARARRQRAAQLAPAVRGRARLRSRRDHRRRRGRRGRHARAAEPSRRRRGRDGRRRADVRGRDPRGRAADRARAGRRRRGRVRRARAHLDARGRVPRGGRPRAGGREADEAAGARRRRGDARRTARRPRRRRRLERAARPAARRPDRRPLLAARVAAPARVRRDRPAHRRLPRALRPRDLAGVRGRRRLPARPRPASTPTSVVGATLAGLAMFAILFLGTILAVFLTLGAVRGDAERGLLQPLLVRPLPRRTLLLGRWLGATAVCAPYVIAVALAAFALTDALGGWWPDRLAGPLLSLALGVAIIAALSLAGSIVLAATANGIAVFMLFGAGLTAGLLGQIAEAIGSDSLDDVAERRHLGAAVRGALPGRAGGADRRHRRLHAARDRPRPVRRRRVGRRRASGSGRSPTWPPSARRRWRRSPGATSRSGRGCSRSSAAERPAPRRPAPRPAPPRAARRRAPRRARRSRTSR